MSKSYKAILFDMDGVLLDSEPLFLRAINASLKAHGVAGVTERENQDLLIGSTIEQTWSRLKQTRNLSKSISDLILDYEKYVLQIFTNPLSVRPGVHKLISYCTDNQIPIAVASSSQHRWIDIKLKAIGLANVFDSVMGGDDVVNGKPDPEVYVKSAEKLGINPEWCIAIEDSPVGIKSAVQSGAFTIAVRSDSTIGMDVSRAHIILETLEYFEYSLLT